MELTRREKAVVEHVLSELLMHKYQDLNLIFGTETIKEMQKLYGKLTYADFCERHGVAYEDMTEADYEQAYREKWES